MILDMGPTNCDVVVLQSRPMRTFLGGQKSPLELIATHQIPADCQQARRMAS
jgi:hypothetical protein